MERKKLKFMDVNEEDVLDRDQMRNIMAGSGCGGSESGRCVGCFTPNGYDCWYRKNPLGTAASICESIYPKYGSGNVDGTFTDCGGCHMN